MPADKAVSLPLFRPTSGLAANPLPVVRSSVIMAPPIDTEAKLLRAKGRLYVLCQFAGWGAYLTINLFFSGAFADSGDPTQAARDKLTSHAVMVLIVLLGLLLTHFARPLMTRWGGRNSVCGRWSPACS